jgi:KAP family P-loop domain
MKVTIPPIYERLTKEELLSLNSFGRQKYARNLIALFKESSAGLVITINSNWGDGKTTFIKMWEEMLRQDNQFIPIYFDAFQNDFSGDAFLSIATLIHQTLMDRKEEYGIDPKNERQLDYLKQSSKTLALDFAMMGTGMAISSLSGGVIDKGILTRFLNWFRKTVLGIYSINIDQKFQAHIDSQNNIKKYKDKLRDILSQDNDTQSKKIIFFVDELDRCRPDFAIEVIEKIKHLFSADNVYFVLAINHEQLISTIGYAYGVDESDAAIYLQKFVHIETNLPPIEHKDVGSNFESVKEFLVSLSVEYQINKYINSWQFDFIKLAEFVSKDYLGLNPRGIERMYSLMAVGLGSINEEVIEDVNMSSSSDANSTGSIDDQVKARIVAMMAALKIGRPVLYEYWKNGMFVHDPGRNIAKEKKIWEFLKAYFDDLGSTEANNTFKVLVVSDICQILDIYEFPIEVKVEESWETPNSSKKSGPRPA